MILGEKSSRKLFMMLDLHPAWLEPATL